jgi:hypothetical protein
VGSGVVLVGSGGVLVGSGRFWCSSGEFFWVLVSSGEFFWVLLGHRRWPTGFSFVQSLCCSLCPS